MVIGTIARLDPVKDLGTLIRAVAELSRHVAATLVVVGDGSERAALETLARDLGVSDRVRFLGQRDDAREWLAGCDVYVNSSISEGVSLTILEAMAAALPVIATRVGGTRKWWMRVAAGWFRLESHGRSRSLSWSCRVIRRCGGGSAKPRGGV